jgi:hypothetical protein
MALQDDKNQNLTGGQKILIHCHHCFGHLDLLSVQQILRAPPFLMPKLQQHLNANCWDLSAQSVNMEKGIEEGQSCN